MRPELPKKIKRLLIEHRIEKEFIWRALVGRTDSLRDLARNDDQTFFYRLAERIDSYTALEELYRNLIEKRSKPSGQNTTAQNFSPSERHAIPITERLIAGLDKTWFKLN